MRVTKVGQLPLEVTMPVGRTEVNHSYLLVKQSLMFNVKVQSLTKFKSQTLFSVDF